MSEQASLFLLSIGLLGEYCPSPRKKDRNSGCEVGCMHLKCQEDNIHRQYCQFMRPAPFLWNSYNLEGVTAVEGDNTLLY